MGDGFRLEEPAGSAQHLLLCALSIPLGEHSPALPCAHTSFAAFFQLQPMFLDQHGLLDMEVKEHFPGFGLRPSWSLGSALT